MIRRPRADDRRAARSGERRTRSQSSAAARLVALAGLAVVVLVAATAVGAAPLQPNTDADGPSVTAAADGLSANAAAAGGMHGTHVDVDTQISSDGTVMVETLSTLRPGFVVLRADDGGSPGDPIGHARVLGTGYQSAVPVAVDDATWDGWSGNRTLWAVLHRDDGDGQFDPASDPAMTARNPAARAQFTLRRSASGDARVLGTGPQALPLSDGAVTFPRVDLPAAGHLVVEPIDGGEPVGTTPLDAGSHANVTVALNDSFVADQQDRFRVRAVAYRDNGEVDGALDAGDHPVTVAGDPVATVVVVRSGDDAGVVVLTPEPTGTDASDPGAPGASDGAATDGPPTDGPPTDGPTATASATGPGFVAFGAVGALALLAATLLAVRRVRQTRPARRK